MIFLQMALYCEARPILQHFAFRALAPYGRFQRWENEEMTLTLSGTGQAMAATCAAVTFARQSPSAGDLFVVLGTCAALHASSRTGTLYQASRIEDLGSGHVCYPDPMVDLGLPEASLLSGYQDLASQKKHVWFSLEHPEADLYDMESAGALAAAGQFFGPHQTIVLRLPTDSGEDAGNLTADAVSESMEKELGTLERVFERLRRFEELLSEGENEMREEDLAALRDVQAALRCSQSMAIHLRQLVTYAVHAGIPYREILQSYAEDGLMPVPGRKEGKELLARFERELTR